MISNNAEEAKRRGYSSGDEEIERLRKLLTKAVALLRRFEESPIALRPHFLSSDVELFLRDIGGEDE